MNNIPVIYGKDATVWQKVKEGASCYLYLGRTYAHIIPGQFENGIQKVELKQEERSQFSHVIICALKIASYMTLVLPLLALAINVFQSKVYGSENLSLGKNLFESLPREIQVTVFEHLDGRDLVRCLRVSQAFNELAKITNSKINIAKLQFAASKSWTDREKNFILETLSKSLALHSDLFAAKEAVNQIKGKEEKVAALINIAKMHGVRKKLDLKELLDEALNFAIQIRDDFDREHSLEKIVDIIKVILKNQIEANDLNGAIKIIEEALRIYNLILDEDEFSMHITLTSLKIAKKQIATNDLNGAKKTIEEALTFANQIQDGIRNELLLEKIIDITCKLAKKEIINKNIISARATIEKALMLANKIEGGFSRKYKLSQIPTIIKKIKRLENASTKLSQLRENLNNLKIALKNDRLKEIVKIKLKIAKMQIIMCELNSALDTARDALELLNQIKDHVTKDFMIERIASLVCKVVKKELAKDELNAAKHTRKLAFKIANTIKSSGIRNAVVKNIVNIAYKISKKQLKNNDISKATKTIEKYLQITNCWDDVLLWRIAKVSLKITKKRFANSELSVAKEMLVKSYKIASEIQDDPFKSHILKKIVELNIKIAQKKIDCIDLDGTKEELEECLKIANMISNRPESADDLIRQIKEMQDKIIILESAFLPNKGIMGWFSSKISFK